MIKINSRILTHVLNQIRRSLSLSKTSYQTVTISTNLESTSIRVTLDEASLTCVMPRGGQPASIRLPLHVLCSIKPSSRHDVEFRQSQVDKAYIRFHDAGSINELPAAMPLAVAEPPKAEWLTSNDRSLGYGDLISDGSSIAVSPQFIAKYQASSLVGLDFAATPLRLSNCDREYFLAIPAATCTLLDEIKSGVVINQMRGCDCCRVSAIDKIDQLVINTATWKGDDIFCSGNLFSEIIVTQAFCDFIAKHDLSNFQFIPSSKFSFDYT